MELSTSAILEIFEHLFRLCVKDGSLSNVTHYCSLNNPCILSFSFLQPVYDARLIASSWNAVYVKWRGTFDHQPRFLTTPLFKSTILRSDNNLFIRGRYRVFKTIQDEDDKGVFLACEFGGMRSKNDKDASLSCINVREVVAKVWSSAYNDECRMERDIYEKLHRLQIIQDPRGRLGLPEVLGNGGYMQTMHAIILEKLGPTLEDLSDRFHFTERMVLAAAIQLLDKYSNLHSLGIIHNGMKPANICTSPDSTRTKSLYLIDFGFSVIFDLEEKNLMPNQDFDTSGNKMFMSILGHHGFSLSQRDDLESLAYLLTYLFHGSLPWSDETTSERISLRKMAIPKEELFRGMDSSFIEFWKDLRALAYAEVPGYAGMKARFEDCWKRRGYRGIPGEFDWWRANDLK